MRANWTFLRIYLRVVALAAILAIGFVVLGLEIWELVASRS